jgi:hypothetical protein
MTDRTIATLSVVVGLMIIVGLVGLVAIKTQQEKDTFNKYKQEDQPEATFMDALCSDLRVITK